MKYQKSSLLIIGKIIVIKALSRDYPAPLLRLVLNYPKSTYYGKIKVRKPKTKEQTVTDLVIKTFKESNDNYGWRRIKKEIYNTTGKIISRQHIHKIMKKNMKEI